MLSVLIQTIGGLGLFIFGMKIMSDGLQQVAGDRIKKILAAVSSNRILAVITGTGVTALIQSSSATTVMLIGFVNAGMMSLQQAVGVILGANIGTTITAQLIAFKITDLALPAIALGVALKFFSRRRKHRYVGEVILGFGLLFFGLLTMKNGLAPIKHDPAFVEFFTRFSADSLGGILLCVGTGAALTMIIQSSSATVGLTMTLAMQGLISFPGAVALVLGENIGTTITAQLATIGSGKNAHEAANAHTLFNVIGVLMMIAVFPYFIDLVEFLTGLIGSGPVDLQVGEEKPNVGRYIANAHTIFNVISAVIFTMALSWLVKVTTWLTPHKEEPQEDLFRAPKLDERHTDNPALALPQVRAEVLRMAQAAMTTLTDVTDCLQDRNLKKLAWWRKREDSLDLMQRDISIYLTTLYQDHVTESEAKEIRSLLRMSNNFERGGRRGGERGRDDRGAHREQPGHVSRGRGRHPVHDQAGSGLSGTGHRIHRHPHPHLDGKGQGHRERAGPDAGGETPGLHPAPPGRRLHLRHQPHLPGHDVGPGKDGRLLFQHRPGRGRGEVAAFGADSLFRIKEGLVRVMVGPENPNTP